MATTATFVEQEQEARAKAQDVGTGSKKRKSDEIPSATVRIPPKTESTPSQGDAGGDG